MTKALSIMNFQDSSDISYRSQLFTDEINWLTSKTGNVNEALLIPYAYTGSLYSAYVKQIKDIFTPLNINLVDINSGVASSLILNAKMIVIGGGDINALVTKLNVLKTPTFDPYAALKNCINNGIPFLGWNEGAVISSPKYFNPASTTTYPGIGASVFQMVCNYTNSLSNKNVIKNYLLNNPAVKKVICQVAQLKDDKSSVRLEESGGGMIDSQTEPYPIVIHFEIVNGNLVEY